MRRVSVLMVLVTVLLVATAMDRHPTTLAQDSTPASDEGGVAGGLGFEHLGFGLVEEAPPLPAAFELSRLTFAPGVGFPLTADDPGLSLFYVESGALTVRLEREAVVTRGERLATPGADPQEPIAAGTSFVLGAGDSVVIPPGVVGEVRNDGNEPAVVLAPTLYPVQLPAATPVP